MTQHHPASFIENTEFIVCESADGYSIHAPGSTDEAIASGDAPYLVSSPWPAEEEHVIPPSAFDEARRVLRGYVEAI